MSIPNQIIEYGDHKLQFAAPQVAILDEETGGQKIYTAEELLEKENEDVLQALLEKVVTGKPFVRRLGHKRNAQKQTLTKEGKVYKAGDTPDMIAYKEVKMFSSIFKVAETKKKD